MVRAAAAQVQVEAAVVAEVGAAAELEAVVGGSVAEAVAEPGVPLGLNPASLGLRERHVRRK